MNQLLAPNGKISNLSPEQYQLVRTPAFKEWFGDWEIIANVKELEHDVKNVYKHYVLTNTEEFLFEIAQQSNSSESELIGAKQIVGEKIINYSLQLFPNTKVGEPFISIVSKVVDENGEPLVVYHGTREDFSVFYGGSYFTDDYMNADGYASGEIVLEIFLNIKNPLTINAKGRKWDNLKSKYGSSTRDIVAQLDINKNDGLFFNNINDNWFDDEGEPQNVYYSINPNQIKLADGTNTTFDGDNPDIRYAKGGKVVVLPADIQKYKKIGIEDKYFIEASKDVGLQGINFDSKSILKRIEEQFNNMLDNYKTYLINDDSPSITNFINNEIETHKEQGSSLETIQRLEAIKENPTSRRGVIDDIAKTQNESLEKWVEYLRLSEYKLPFKFLMLKAVLNFNYDLKQNKLFERGRDTIRNYTPFDAGSLAELNEKNSDFLLMDYNVLMNENSSRILNSQEVVEQSGNGKWIKFNGGKKTKSEDIEKNGNRLMNLVQNTYWCTKSAGTNQLRGGDFYVYVTETNGEIFPRIAVRMNEDKVGEVRGNKSSAQDLDAEMLPIAEDFLLKNIPNDSGKKWLDSIKYNKKCVDMRKRFEVEGMYKDFIYDYIKLIADKDKYKVDYGANGNVTLLEQKFEELIQVSNEYYKKGDIVTDAVFLSPKTKYFIGDIGFYVISKVLENDDYDLIDLNGWDLKLVSGYFDCKASRVINLGNIEFIGNDLTISERITDLGKLKYVGNELNLSSSIESLNNLESIGGGLVLKSNLRDLGKLKKVGFLQINACDDNFTLGSLEEIEGDLNIEALDKDIDFGKLKKIGGSLFAGKSMVTNLKELESVGNNFSIFGSKIKLFPNLKTIGGNTDFSNNFCSSTQNIETILGDIKFLNSRIMEFPKLNKIGGTIEFRGSYFKSFGNIKYIGGNLNFAESKLEELGDLEYIGGYVSFKSSKIKSLNKLKNIVGFANFEGSEVEDLGDLESVGGNIYLAFTKIKSLGKLNYIGGLVMMNKNNFKGLEEFREQIKAELNK